jgi:hypothetical protein
MPVDDAYADRPSSARIYDALLGGSHNFAVDRAAAQKLLEAIPYAGDLARRNRTFLRRAVELMLAAGVRQFLDIGSGIPTVGNVHEVTRRIAPEATVVYVDIDPVAVAHSRDILAESPVATAVQADARFPDALLAHPALVAMLDFRRPIGLLMVSLLHFLPDEEAFVAVERLRAALAPGSYIAISHGVAETLVGAPADQVSSIYRRTDVPVAAGRTRADILRFFGGAELVPPGLVWLHEWPVPPADGERPEYTAVLAGVGRVTGAA